jgi:hypothetical protein
MSANEEHHVVQEASRPDPGTRFRNTLPQDEPEIIEKHEQETPTMSHELANADHVEKGAAQEDHGQTEVRDLGWNSPLSGMPSPMVGGLSNDELWTLIRRFNKVGALLGAAWWYSDSQ